MRGWLCGRLRLQQAVQHGKAAAFLRGCATRRTAFLGGHCSVLSAVRPDRLLCALKAHSSQRYRCGDASSRCVSLAAQRSGAGWRGIGCTPPIRAETDNEEQALQWSGSFDGKLKMLMMEAAALERELCENPAPDRQAVIGEPRLCVFFDWAARTYGVGQFHLLRNFLHLRALGAPPPWAPAFWTTRSCAALDLY
jgi:hypothetical protein